MYFSDSEQHLGPSTDAALLVHSGLSYTSVNIHGLTWYGRGGSSSAVVET